MTGHGQWRARHQPRIHHRLQFRVAPWLHCSARTCTWAEGVIYLLVQPRAPVLDSKQSDLLLLAGGALRFPRAVVASPTFVLPKSTCWRLAPLVLLAACGGGDLT